MQFPKVILTHSIDVFSIHWTIFTSHKKTFSRSVVTRSKLILMGSRGAPWRLRLKGGSGLLAALEFPQDYLSCTYANILTYRLLRLQANVSFARYFGFAEKRTSRGSLNSRSADTGSKHIHMGSRAIAYGTCASRCARVSLQKSFHDFFASPSRGLTPLISTTKKRPP